MVFSKKRSPVFAAILGIMLGFLIMPQPAFAKTHHKSKTKTVHKSRTRTVRTIRQHNHGRVEVVRKTVVVRYLPPVRNFTTVVIDAGHGGHDNGGIFGQRIPEKPYTLDTAIRLRAILRKAGFQTVMTRTNDTFIPLPERVRIANAQHNAIFVSIHFNSSIIPTGHGIETYYYAPNAQPLAARIQARVMRANPGTENRGVKTRGYFVLRKTSIPSVLVEGGFLTNGPEAGLIQQSSFRQHLAQMIAQAIIEQRGS
jgi:N-acetylmuramoyl-L-alanine amidase